MGVEPKEEGERGVTIRKLPDGLRICFQFYFKGDEVEEDFIQFEAPDLDRFDEDLGALVEKIREKLSIQLGHTLTNMKQEDITKHLKKIMAGEFKPNDPTEGSS